MNNLNYTIYTNQTFQTIPTEELNGLVMVIGNTDVGKSTLCQYLYNCLLEMERSVAYLDGDPGQGILGPPTTVSIIYNKYTKSSNNGINNQKSILHRFIGSTSPRGHMLDLLVNVHALVLNAQKNGIENIIYDTTGLINPAQGGLALKLAKIQLLEPTYIIGIQKDQELMPLLSSVARSGRSKVIFFNPSPSVTPRDLTTRRSFRQNSYKSYFRDSNIIKLGWNDYPVFPFPKYSLNQLIGFEDKNGMLLSLGLIKDIDRMQKVNYIYTPIKSLNKVNAIHLGDVLVDPENYNDTKLEV